MVTSGLLLKAVRIRTAFSFSVIAFLIFLLQVLKSARRENAIR